MSASSGGGPPPASRVADVFTTVARASTECVYRNMQLDSEDEEDAVSLTSWVSDSVPAGARITTIDTTGLRRVCACKDETSIRALYLRRAVRPKPLQRWRAKYPWVARLFTAAISCSDPDPRGYHETFRAAWAYTIAKAFHRAEVAGITFFGPNDPSFQVLLGPTIEYTPVSIPFPIPSDLRGLVHDFYGHQRSLMSHMAQCDRAGYLTPSERLPGHLARPASPVLERPPPPPPPLPADVEATEQPDPDVVTEAPFEPQATGGCLDVADSPPVSGGFTPTLDDAVEMASNHSGASQLSADAPIFSPTRPPEGFERDETSLAGVRPVIHASRPRPRSAPSSLSEERVPVRSTPQTVAPAPPAVPPTATAGPSGVAQWVAEIHASSSGPTLLPSMGPRRPLGEPSPARSFATQTPKKLERGPERGGRRSRRARRSMRFATPEASGSGECELKNPPRMVSPEYSPSFFDEGPVYEDVFRRVSGAVGEDEPDQVPCNHALFKEALSRKRLRDPRRYCRHVRRGLALVMMRHPGDWGIDRDSCQVLGAFVENDMLPKDATGDKPLWLGDLQYTDPAPIRPLQDYYSVDVRNRFTPLFVDEIDTIEADLSDCDELTAPVARAAQKKGKGAYPSGGPSSAEGQRRKRRDQEERLTREQLQDVRKTKDQKKRDGKAALRRITAKIAHIDVRDIDVAKTVVAGHLSPAVRKLVEEHHHWLREPEEAYRRGRWYWAAACINNNTEPFIATTGLFTLIRGLGDLCRATGSTGWVRDLCADGDIESNPGPVGVVNAPTDGVDVTAGTLYWDWISDEEGIAANPTAASVEYLSKVTSRPSGYAEDVNEAVLVDGRWLRAVPTRGISFKADSWSTNLYPTTLGDRAVRVASQNSFLVRDADAACHLDSVPHTAVPKPPLQAEPSPGYAPTSPPSVGTPLRDESSGSTSGASTAPRPGPTDEELRAQHIHPDQPDVVLAALDRHGSVLRVTSSRGDGVALPLQGTGVLPRLAHNDARVHLIGRMQGGVAAGSLRYAARQPITMVVEAEGPPSVFINGRAIPFDDAAFLRALKTPESPSVTAPSGAEVFLIGEWYPVEGNGTAGTLHHRTWGPPKFAFIAQTGVVAGSSLSPTTTGTEEKRDSVTKPVLVPRTEITALGIDRTTTERLSLTPIAWSTTCEANALKLGLMLDWARYGERDACHMNVFTGQAQVHEPRVRVARDTEVRRLFNASGFPREDCGGMVVPCFPFHERWKRGRIRFYATAQLVPKGEPFLVLPACFDGESTFTEAAVFLLTFLPWPWGNMSIAVQTVLDGTAEEREQIYAWHGTTTAVPGSFNLNVVLHQLNVGEFVSGRTNDLELGVVPRMGPAPVEFWPGDVPIPVNCKAGQRFFVPAAAFAASWACGFGVRDVKAVVTKISVYGLFDKVERWIIEGPCVARTHAGLMAVRRTKMDAEATVELPLDQAPPIMFDIVNSPVDAPIPLMYRCWAAAGNQMEHIPSGAAWSDVRLTAEAKIILPNIMSLTMVYAGFWKFDSHMELPRPEVDWRLLSGAQFLNCERMFVAWHMWHGMMGLDIGTINKAARSELPGRGESEYYDGLFGYGALEAIPTLGNLLRQGLEKVLGGRLLRSAQGTCILQRLFPPRNWTAQVYDLTAVAGLDRVCPTPLTDIYIYKYLSEVPKAWQPFRVAYNGIFNMDTFSDENVPKSYPPEGSAGTFIWSDTNRFQDVDLDDVVYVRDHALWLNRLVHSYDEYQLREFRDGSVVPGSPPPGYAPVCLVRGEDSWSGPTPRFWTESPPYPFFSTVWSSWMSSINHRVLTLQCELENPTQWYELINGPAGARASGVVFDVVLQPSIAMPSRATREKRRLTQMAKASENRDGGVVTDGVQQVLSKGSSGETPDDPPANVD